MNETALRRIATRLRRLYLAVEEARRPVDRKTANAAFQGACEVVGDLVGTTSSGPWMVTMTAVTRAGRPPLASPTMPKSARLALRDWKAAVDDDLVRRLALLESGDIQAATA